MPSFPKGLTLNTTVSILSTGSKSSLLCMVGASIGQLKWLWFREEKKRPLYDLQSFDEASRGPWGSLNVLLRCSRKGGPFLILLGAIITIFSLAFDPFMQQIVQFPVRQVADSSGVAAVKQAVLPFCPGSRTESEFLVRPIQTGLWSQGFSLNPSCSSGNCTWPSFKSAGWCSRCADTTSTATLLDCDISPFNTNINESLTVPCNISLSDGIWIENVITVKTGDKSWHDWNFTIEFKKTQISEINNKTGPYLNQSILGVRNPLLALAYTELSPFHVQDRTDTGSMSNEMMRLEHATLCVLSPCVKSYNVSVTNGVPYVQKSPPDFGEIYNSEDDPPFLIEPDMTETYKHKLTSCWKPTRDAPVDVTIKRENWPPKAALWKNATFAGCPIPLFTESWLAGFTNSTYEYNYTAQTWNNRITYVEYVHLLSVKDSNFANVMSNVAASLTEYARDISNLTVQGVSSVPQVYVSVDWAFLALPGLLLLLGIIFLLLIISVNKKHELGLWKSSILPMLFHGPPEWMGLHEYATASTMEKISQETTVSLKASNSEGRLFLQK